MTPVPVEPAARRHQTRQRARILAWLRETDSHPTAAQTHEALVRELPNLSLGTVYRNLEVLVSEGVIGEVPSAGGGVRYDGNAKPHHHFICERCGAIDDLHLKAPPELARKLRRARGRTARRIQIDFYGLCESCESPRPSGTRLVESDPRRVARHPVCSQGEAKCLRTKIGGRIS